MDSIDENPSLGKFKDEFIVSYPKTDSQGFNQQVNKSCKVIKFDSECTFNKILSFIPKINEYPNLFIVVIEIENFKLYEEKIQTIKHLLSEFSRAIILQIITQIDNKIIFYYKKEDKENQFHEVKVEQNDEINFENLNSYLCCFATGKIQDYEDKMIKILPRVENSTLILRFLRTLELSDRLFMNLIYNCSEDGSKDDFLAALDAPLEGEGRFLNQEAEDFLSETVMEGEKVISILYTAIQYSNEDVVNYLITHCTHLIQQLPFEHRINISTAAFDDGKVDVLCDLLEYSDFPFPSNINFRSVTNERLNKIYIERKLFHEAIQHKNEADVKSFIDTHFNHKIAYDVKNQSALYKAISTKNFEEYCRLKSLGFRSEDSEKCEECEEKLTQQEKSLLSKQENIQTKINADSSISDSKKSINLLSARSMIHNRKISKAEEIEYRKHIIKWLEELCKIEICKDLLDAAAQCEDLKIIFDFESFSVSKIMIKIDSMIIYFI